MRKYTQTKLPLRYSKEYEFERVLRDVRIVERELEAISHKVGSEEYAKRIEIKEKQAREIKIIQLLFSDPYLEPHKKRLAEQEEQERRDIEQKCFLAWIVVVGRNIDRAVTITESRSRLLRETSIVRKSPIELVRERHSSLSL